MLTGTGRLTQHAGGPRRRVRPSGRGSADAVAPRQEGREQEPGGDEGGPRHAEGGVPGERDGVRCRTSPATATAVRSLPAGVSTWPATAGAMPAAVWSVTTTEMPSAASASDRSADVGRRKAAVRVGHARVLALDRLPAHDQDVAAHVVARLVPPHRVQHGVRLVPRPAGGSWTAAGPARPQADRPRRPRASSRSCPGRTPRVSRPPTPHAGVGEQQHGQQHQSHADDPTSRPGSTRATTAATPDADRGGHRRGRQHQHPGAVADHAGAGDVRGQPARRRPARPR